MTRLRAFTRGLRGLFRSKRVERELDEELQSYLECSIAEKVRSGMAHENARRHARVELGSIEAVKDHTRDVGWETTVEQTWRDVRYAARTLRKSPAFAAVVVLTLALGIGANTAIFSAVNAIMLRALAVERPDELVALTALYPGGAEPFSYSAYRRIAADGAPVVDVLAASTARRDGISIDGPPEVIDLKWVSGSYFAVLGVSTSIGRPLLASDDPQPPGPAVAVLSDAFWTRRLGRGPTGIRPPATSRGRPRADRHRRQRPFEAPSIRRSGSRAAGIRQRNPGGDRRSVDAADRPAKCPIVDLERAKAPGAAPRPG